MHLNKFIHKQQNMNSQRQPPLLPSPTPPPSFPFFLPSASGLCVRSASRTAPGVFPLLPDGAALSRIQVRPARNRPPRGSRRRDLWAAAGSRARRRRKKKEEGNGAVHNLLLHLFTSIVESRTDDAHLIVILGEEVHIINILIIISE